METQEKKIAGVSVIICCYNSETRIPKTLEYLAKQVVLPSIPWEIILVDNNCTDDTIVIAKETWDLHATQTPLIIIKEEIPGLSYARKKGLSEVKFDTIIFCDDDNWLNPNYIQIAYDLIQSNSRIGVIGGYGEPEWEIQPPAWLIDCVGSYATGPQGQKSGEVYHTHHVYGAGMVIRKDAIDQLDQLNFQGFLTGRNGKKMLAGDDHELCYAIHLCGYQIWYDERLKFKHFIPTARIKTSYLKKMLKGFAVCGPLLSLYKIRINSTTSQQFEFRSNRLILTLNRVRLFIRSIFQFSVKFLTKSERLYWIYYRLYSYVAFVQQFKNMKACQKSILTLWPYENDSKD